MTSRRQLQKVESADVSYFHARNIPECLNEGHVGTAVNNQGTTTASESSVSELAFASADLDGINDLLDISPGTHVLKEPHSFLGPFNFLSSVTNNSRELLDVVNSVSPGLDQREDG